MVWIPFRYLSPIGMREREKERDFITASMVLMSNLAITFQMKRPYSSGVWLGENQATNTIKIHMFKRDWTMPLLTTPHSTVKHNWEDPCHM